VGLRNNVQLVIRIMYHVDTRHVQLSTENGAVSAVATAAARYWFNFSPPCVIIVTAS